MNPDPAAPDPAAAPVPADAGAAAPIEPPARRLRKYITRGLLIGLVVACGYGAWSVNDFQKAVDEVQRPPFKGACAFFYEDPFSQIRKHWWKALRPGTWTGADRRLNVWNCKDLLQRPGLIERLAPREVYFEACNIEDLRVLSGVTSVRVISPRLSTLKSLAGIEGCTGLEVLNLGGCGALENLDALAGMRKLRALDLNECRSLKNIDGLKAATDLKLLMLSGCASLTSIDGISGARTLHRLVMDRCRKLTRIDALRGHPTLEYLNLNNCTALTSVDALATIPRLKVVELYDCPAIPAAAIEALRKANPKLDVRPGER